MRSLVRVGHPMPDFVLPDLGGLDWTQADLIGLPTVLFLFSSW
jgi:peroxiredoxin